MVCRVFRGAVRLKNVSALWYFPRWMGCLSYIVNTIAADVLAMHGSRPSAVMILTTSSEIFHSQNQKGIFFSLNARVILLRFFSLNAILHRGSCAGDLHFFYILLALGWNRSYAIPIVPVKQIWKIWVNHYSDVIMSAIASQITDVSIACSTVGLGAA